MYTKVFVFWKMFQCLKVFFWEIVLKCAECFFENSKDVCKFDQVTRSIYLPTQKYFLHILTLLHCCFTIVFGKQPCIWMLNGTCVGHRMTMITMLPSIFCKFFEGLDHLCIGSQDSVIEGLWSFVLILFCQDT